MSGHITVTGGILACGHCSVSMYVGEPMKPNAKGAANNFSRAHQRCVEPGMCACIKCGQVKPKTDKFFYRKGLPGRLDSQCKVCRNTLQNAARKAQALEQNRAFEARGPRVLVVPRTSRLLPVPDTPYRTVWRGGNPFEAKA